jgi:hypothetical protein
MKPHVEEAWRALRPADHDIQAFTVLAASPEVHRGIIGFHAQQAVEKSLKAALFSRRIEFRRTHNLTYLASLLRRNGMNPPLADGQLMRLNPFAVALRYDEMDVPSLKPDELAGWVADVRVWAEKQVRATEPMAEDGHGPDK